MDPLNRVRGDFYNKSSSLTGSSKKIHLSKGSKFINKQTVRA